MEAGSSKQSTAKQVNISTQKVEVKLGDAPAANASPGMAGSGESLKYLLGGAAVLQAVLTAVGISTGGVAALAINHRWLVVLGFGFVIGSVAIGAAVLALGQGGGPVGKIAACVGTALLFAGIFITAYAALIEPGVAKTPNLNIALSESSSKGLTVTAHVTASGIKENTPYWLEIDAREYRKESKGGKYVPLGTPLYQNQLGADGKGNINSIVTIPILAENFSVISVEAWNGAHAGPCGSLEVEGGANLTQLPKKNAAATLEESSRPGCVVVRLPRLSPAGMPPSAAASAAPRRAGSSRR